MDEARMMGGGSEVFGEGTGVFGEVAKDGRLSERKAFLRQRFRGTFRGEVVRDTKVGGDRGDCLLTSARETCSCSERVVGGTEDVS